MKGSSALILAVACYCLTIGSCEREPVISQISNEQIKEIGDAVEFNCTVQNVQKYPILWIKLDKDRLDRVPLSTNTTRIIADPRFVALYDETTSTFVLRIKELQETDTGFYQCQVLINVSNKVTAEVELQIRRPPTISRNSTSQVNVTEGRPVELRCHADGFPVPRIAWKRENDLLLPSGGAIYRGNVLKIESAHRDDRGVYFCVAENDVGVEARSNATVLVDFAPVITAIRPRVGQAQGYNVALECRVEAHPLPTVTWLRDGQQIKSDLVAEQPDEFVAVLQKYSIGEADFGEYVCRAENKYGAAETKVELFETMIPVCASSCG